MFDLLSMLKSLCIVICHSSIWHASSYESGSCTSSTLARTTPIYFRFGFLDFPNHNSRGGGSAASNCLGLTPQVSFTIDLSIIEE